MESQLRLMPEDLTCAPSGSLTKLVQKTAPPHTYEPFPSLHGTFSPLPRLAARTCYQSHLVWLITYQYHFSFSDHGPWVDLLTLKSNGVRRQGC